MPPALLAAKRRHPSTYQGRVVRHARVTYLAGVAREVVAIHKRILLLHAIHFYEVKMLPRFSLLSHCAR